MTKKKIIIIDDHPLLREGVRSMLESHDQLEVIGEYSEGKKGFVGVREKNPDLVILDLKLKDISGFDVLKEIHQTEEIHSKVIVLSMHNEDFYAYRCLKAGASAYITKKEASTTLLDGIKAVLSGEIYLSGSGVSEILKGIGGKRGGSKISELSERELEIFEQIGYGKKNQQIAHELSISVKTVEVHRNNILKKLDLKGSSELSALASEIVLP